MSYWPAIFIVLAIAMAVGPIMIMKPSRRDQRLAGLRQKAAKLGLQVRISDYEGRSTAVYSLPVALPKHTPSWQLLKQSYTHGIHFHQKWQLLEHSAKVPPSLESDIKAYLDNMYDDVVGIEVDKKAVSVWWLENPNAETVEDIYSSLERLYKMVI